MRYINAFREEGWTSLPQRTFFGAVRFAVLFSNNCKIFNSYTFFLTATYSSNNGFGVVRCHRQTMSAYPLLTHLLP
tara:strand:+ start:40 stop:267 length:228 start_codon:yes stop_codon:yes gene_type:complete